MTRERYVNLSIPKTLIDKIDKMVEKQAHGYTSRAEFVKDAIRGRLRELE